ncbi:MAG: PHP domain-containing protein [Legionellales bacterium]|nr:PHP domain-containing protein [Legionellales bacterium]
MVKIFDLHMHTVASDGFFSFEKLIFHMQSLGVNVISITDHDILSRAEIVDGITVIPGAEITTRWNSESVIHILGLNLNKESVELNYLLKTNRDIRSKRAELMDSLLSKKGYDGSLQYILDKFSPKSIGRLHFARFLKDCRYVKNWGQAFKDILLDIKIKEKFNWPSLEEVIQAIHSAGGQAVIAHPLKYGLQPKGISKLIKKFRELNGDGIELISGNMTHKELKFISELAKPYGLLASLGSDFNIPKKNKPFNVAKYNNCLKSYAPIWSEWGLS